MKIARRSLLAVLALLACSLSARADLDAGLAAFEAGDYAIAYRLLSTSATAAEPTAQFHVGRMHAEGLGLPRSMPRAIAWFRRAAEQGHVESCYRLAIAYGFGHGVDVDGAEALRWYRAAARQGHADAQLQLGLRLPRDLFRELIDGAEAVHWLSAAAEQGVASAQWELVSIHTEGRHGRPDPVLAARWAREAALQGVVGAQLAMGLIHEYGRGVARDRAEARRWYGIAARNGSEAAQRRLAFDSRLRVQHLRTARFTDWTADGPIRVRTVEEIRRGPRAPVELSPDDRVDCEFFPRANRGGNPKFRCFMMTAPAAEGGRYYDEDGVIRPEADGILLLEAERGVDPVLAVETDEGALVPLRERDAFRLQVVRPLELKVKYRPLAGVDPISDRDMFTEVAATRLLWALHYAADRMYRVRQVHCYRCPEDPFRMTEAAPTGESTRFDEVAIELRYGGAGAENAQRWQGGGWSWGDELYELRYGDGPEAFSSEQKDAFDGLLVLMNLLSNATVRRGDQNRLACIRGTIQQLGPYKFCPDTVLLVHDLGSVFGKRQRSSLESWRSAPMWDDVGHCRLEIPEARYGEFIVRPYAIGESGRLRILDLLDQLTDAHLRAIFEAADFARFDLTFRAASPDERIDAWIAAFRDRVDLLRAARCDG